MFRIKHFYMGGSTGSEDGRFCMFPLKAPATFFSRCSLNLFLCLSPPPQFVITRRAAKPHRSFTVVKLLVQTLQVARIPLFAEIDLSPANTTNWKLFWCRSLESQTPNWQSHPQLTYVYDSAVDGGFAFKTDKSRSSCSCVQAWLVIRQLGSLLT